MRKQYVLVEAWVPDPQEGQPSHPIVLPPPYPDQGLPPIPPGYWGGIAPPLPTHPIAPGGPPPTVWPPPVYPDQGLPGPQPPPGTPTHPIYNPPYPDQGLPGVPPGYWGGVAPPLPTHPIAPGGPPPIVSPPIYYPPYPDQGLPVPPPIPTHPIAPGGPPPGIWPSPGVPTHPIYLPPGTPPVIDIGDLPEHPEVPDLNAGNWMYVLDGRDYKSAFVPWPLAVTHPDYNPNYPEQGLPGTWVVIYYGQPTWAWIPTSGSTTPPPTNGGDAHPDHELPGDQPHPDQGLPGDQPEVDNTLPEEPQPEPTPQ